MPPALIHLVAGARPNFMKVAPVFHALRPESWCQPMLIHTGQHYDANMSDNFLRDLALPSPQVNLGVGSGTHAEQTAGVMVSYERLCLDQVPNWIIVVGDVNSTMACALVAAKLCIPLAHLEAGLRSRDRTMPEEINRVVTDAVADLLWTPSRDADANLRSEGVPEERIERVGNIMIDSYELLRNQIERERGRERLGLAAQGYGVVTLHRPSNVDDPKELETIVTGLLSIAEQIPLVFPVHPRTSQRLKDFGLADRLSSGRSMHTIEPIGYIQFMSLVREAAFVITDSGGVQEETTYLGIPCLTLRDTTERPITITEGTNRLVGSRDLGAAISQVIAGDWSNGGCPEMWDGRTAARVVESLKSRVGGSVQ